MVEMMRSTRAAARTAAKALKRIAGSLPHKIDYIRPPPFLESDLNDAETASGTNLMAMLNLDI